MEAVAEPTVAPRTAKARFVVTSVRLGRHGDTYVTLQGPIRMMGNLSDSTMELHFQTKDAAYPQAHLQPGSTVWVTLEPADD